MIGMGLKKNIWMSGLILLVCLGAFCGCKESTKVESAQVAECFSRTKVDGLIASRAGYIDQDEYRVLSALGRPAEISMNTRSEKVYLYPLCKPKDMGQDTSAHHLVIRFSGTGRVKEMYEE
jgi:hypothetical protein